MNPKKRLLLTINLLGGAAVLGSYAGGIRTHPNAVNVLWGGVPASIQPFYTAGMFLAAAGYFAILYFILFRLDPDKTSVWHRSGFDTFNVLFAAILIPSSLWMPLTFAAVEATSGVLLWVVRLVLAAVGLASLGLLTALLNTQPRRPLWAYWLALIGCAAFCLQTAVLDMIVWSAYFTVYN
ncbi:MAG TPA: hypothetical protein VF784_13885 [Anaerolineales bacterium]